jgi:IS5 family transposase
MIRERHVQMNIYDGLYPIEFVKLDPELEKIDQILDENPIFLMEFIELMASRAENSKTFGRGSEPAEAILRMLLLRRRYNWSFRDTQKFVSDSLSLRKFTRLFYEDVPDYSTLCRYDNLVTDEFLQSLNDAVVGIAKERKVTRGRKMRTDTTAVESDTHYPTDSRQLYDGVRVLSRLSRKCRELGVAAGETVRDYRRSAKKQVLKVVKYAKSRCEEGQEQFKRTCQKLMEIGKRALSQARKQVILLSQQAHRKAQKVQKEIESVLPLIEKVIDQSKRRLFKGEAVPNTEKVYSIFQPDIYCIRKGKSGKPNEFGKKVRFDQSDGKIISGWEIYGSNRSDTETFIPALERHIRQFGRAPNLVAGDRGCYSEANEQKARDLGVQRISLPKRGYKSASRKVYEKQRWFKTGQRFRAGSEGTISVLKRRHGLDRCLNRGDNAFDRWIGWSVIAYNLITVANA